METTRNVPEELLTRGVEEVIVREHLEERLRSGKKLRVKFGIDPTAPDIHLGHTVPIRKLRAFQELGHTAVLIIGDFTAMIGDPSGKSSARPPMTRAEIEKNMQTYLVQVGKILDVNKAEIRYNSEWYASAGVAFLYDLMSKVTVQRAIERDDFQKRIADGHDITILEMIYPLLQGYDSVAVRADVELGGTDQKFNLLTGRKIQRRYDVEEQDIMTTWLIEGTDGTRKMSKSLGNYIGLTEEPDEMFGKIMSIPDTLIAKYFRGLTAVPEVEIAQMEGEMQAGGLNPRDAKLELGEAIVGRYADKKAAAEARKHFVARFSDRTSGAEQELPSVAIPHRRWMPVPLLVEHFGVSSNAEARRLVLQRAVEIDGAVVVDPQQEVAIQTGSVIRVGKKKMVRVA